MAESKSAALPLGYAPIGPSQGTAEEQATLGLPKIGLPKIGLPKIGLPKIGLPKIGLPKIGLPKILAADAGL
jgi:GLTT repeat (6 copies)